MKKNNRSLEIRLTERSMSAAMLQAKVLQIS